MKQWFLARATLPSGLASGTTRYFGVTFGRDAISASSAIYVPVASARTVERLYVSLTNAPGAGNTLQIVLLQNGTDTAVSVSISGTATTGEWTGTLSLAATDRIAYKVVWTGGTSIAVGIRCALLVSGGTDQEGLLWGNTNASTLSNVAVRYLMPATSLAPQTNESRAQFLVPDSGQITGMRVALNGSPGAGKQYTFRLRKNQTDVGDPIVISDPSTAGDVTFATPVSVTAGDLICISSTPSGTPTAIEAYVALRYTAGTALRGWYGGSAPTSTSSTVYDPLNGSLLSALTSALQQYIPDAVSVGLWGVRLSADPGTGKSFTFDLVSGESADTVLRSVTISDTNTYAYDNQIVSFAGGAIGVRITPTNTPTGSLARWSCIIAVSTGVSAQLSWAEFEVPDAPRQAQISWTEFEVPDVPRAAQISWAEFEVPTATRQAQVSWAEFEVPTAPRQAQISWTEFEVPDAPRAAQISWAEFEVPTAPRQAQISWAEFEVPDAPRAARISWTEFEVPDAPRAASLSWAEFEIPDLAARQAQVSWTEFEIPTAPRQAQISWTEFEVPDAPRAARISWAEFSVPDAPRAARVSWTELEVPDAPRQAQISWAEFEVPTAPRQARISWAEFEVPTAPRQAQISWAEMQVPDAPRQAQISWVEFEAPTAPRQAQISWVVFEIPEPVSAQISWAVFEVGAPEAAGSWWRRIFVR